MSELKHDFKEELISELADEFDPSEFVKQLDISNGEDITSCKSDFEEYGEVLIRKSIKIGEENPDRIYELMKDAAEKTGELKFPLFPERYLELAYLSIQPFRRLWVNANSPELFSFEIKNCALFNCIEEEYGEASSSKMACSTFCFKMIDEAFENFDFNIEKSMPENMAENEKCLFEIVRMDG